MITVYEFIMWFLLWPATWTWRPIGVNTATTDSLRDLVLINENLIGYLLCDGYE